MKIPVSFNFFAFLYKQCKLINNNRKIPSEAPQKSIESVSSITFEINDIEKIV